MSGPGLNLSDMGIGAGTPNDADLAQPVQPRYTEDQFMAELGQMIDNEDKVDEIAAASDVQAPPMRELRPDTSTPRPVVIDPTADQQTEQQAGQPAEGGNSNDAAPTGQELSDPAGTSTTDDLPFTLPPTGDDQTASPGEGGGGAQTTVTEGSSQGTPTIDLNRIAQEVYGANVTEDQARQILRLAKDLDGLNPQQLAGINQIVNGGGYVPQQTYQPQPQPPAQQFYQQPPAPQPPLPQPAYPPNPQQTPGAQIPQIDDPELAQYLAPIYQQTQQLQQAFQAQQAAILQEQQLRMQQEAQAAAKRGNEAQQEWFAAHQEYLSPEEAIIVEQRAIDSGMLQVFNERFRDAGRAVTETLNYVFQNDPTFQERVIARKVQEQQALITQQQQRTSTSTALSGGGGAKPINNGGSPRTPGAAATNGYASLVDAIAETLQQQN